MLTRDEALVTYDDASGTAIPDRLSRQTHKAYAGYAKRLLTIYEHGVGLTRRELHRAVENVMAAVDDCPARRIAAFKKLLDDVSEFGSDTSGSAAKLRKQVFSIAAKFHPLASQAEGLFGNLESEIKARIAQELQKPWQQIDDELFADVIEFQRMKKFSGYASPQALLSRYNVAQTQAALYSAEELIVWSETDHKMILRYAKLARLMHSIRRHGQNGYCFRFDGPASVLRRSTRYGVAMARFLPGLLACQGWHAKAKIISRFGKRYRLDLSSREGLKSNANLAEEFDSSLEAEFFEDWQKADTGGWKLEHETEILHEGQTVFTPDFTLIAPDGVRRILLEVVGYWTPEYLEAKVRQLEQFQHHDLLLAVPQQTNFEAPAGIQSPIYFKRRLKAADVLARLSTT